MPHTGAQLMRVSQTNQSPVPRSEALAHIEQIDMTGNEPKPYCNECTVSSRTELGGLITDKSLSRRRRNYLPSLAQQEFDTVYRMAADEIAIHSHTSQWHFASMQQGIQRMLQARDKACDRLVQILEDAGKSNQPIETNYTWSHSGPTLSDDQFESWVHLSGDAPQSEVSLENSIRTRLNKCLRHNQGERVRIENDDGAKPIELFEDKDSIERGMSLSTQHIAGGGKKIKLSAIAQDSAT